METQAEYEAAHDEMQHQIDLVLANPKLTAKQKDNAIAKLEREFEDG